MNTLSFKNNNFDLLRLLAASQVLLDHIIDLTDIKFGIFGSYLFWLSSLFPGVPIFFFISGYLISKSFEVNSNVIQYTQNRILRLYPGLLFSIVITILMIYFSGYLDTVEYNFNDILMLIFTKATILQFYNPEFLRGYGDGVFNGNLWTITVELQFYFLMPIVYFLLKPFFKNSIFKQNLIILIIIFIFICINRFYSLLLPEFNTKIWFKLFRVSFAPWFYMFMLGYLFQKYFMLFKKIFANKFFTILVIYLVFSIPIHYYKLFSFGNNMSPILFIPLACTIFSFAYSHTSLGKKLLKGYDISYGIYIYHAPIINLILYLEWKHDMIISFTILFATISLALLSCILIERPAMMLKKHPLNPIK